MRVYPNVKINLGLNVLRKRPDGYHDLETLFVPYYGIHDILEIEQSEVFKINIHKEGGVDWDPMQDLTAKAYRLLAEEFSLPAVSIELTKLAPVGAGLGGGSADAAFCLKAINELFSLGLEMEKLEEYAARLGSDCAFFLHDKPMFGEGRGEILSPFELDLSDYEIRVLCPEGISVRTSEAYGGIIPSLPQIHLKEALSRPVSDWKDCVVNDFEATVFAHHPKLAELKQSLYDAGAIYASMSGSGSALFGIFPK